MSTTISTPDTASQPVGTAPVPNEHDRQLAAASSLAFGPLAAATGDLTLTIRGDEGTTGDMRVPASAVRLLFAALSHMARGKGVSLLPLDTELRTQDAADLLHVSRPYLVGLLEKGAMPFRLVGNQRRVRLGDLMDYKARCDIDGRVALDELARLGQEIGIGYGYAA